MRVMIKKAPKIKVRVDEKIVFIRNDGRLRLLTGKVMIKNHSEVDLKFRPVELRVTNKVREAVFNLTNNPFKIIPFFQLIKAYSVAELPFYESTQNENEYIPNDFKIDEVVLFVRDSLMNEHFFDIGARNITILRS